MFFLIFLLCFQFVEFREDNYESLKRVGYITAFVEAKGSSWVSFLNTSFVDFEKTIQKVQ